MNKIELDLKQLQDIEDFKKDILSQDLDRIQLKLTRISCSKEARDRRLEEDREIARRKAEFIQELLNKRG